MSGWNAIDELHRPTSLEEAAGLLADAETVPVAGGSYLLVDRPKQVKALVNLLPLLDGKIVENKDVFRLGAGATVQQIADHFGESALGLAAHESSSSRNLRSQRTLGGEVVRKRIDSDLRVLLEALDPELELTGVSDKVRLSEWNGSGIIEAINIEFARMASCKLQRFSLIEHSPAFVIVAVCWVERNWIVAVGGRASEIGRWALPGGGNGSGDVSDQVAKLFADDHAGTVEYKCGLVTTALRRMEVIQ